MHRKHSIDAACCYRETSVVRVYWSRPSALQKRLDQSRRRLGCRAGSCGPIRCDVPNTHTAERVTSAATGRVYAMHEVRPEKWIDICENQLDVYRRDRCLRDWLRLQSANDMNVDRRRRRLLCTTDAAEAEMLSL